MLNDGFENIAQIFYRFFIALSSIVQKDSFSCGASLVLFLVFSVIASSSFQNSDNYGDSVPKEFERDSIIFTTPALQNMARAHFSTEEALRLIKLHQKESCFREGLAVFMLSGNRLVSFFEWVSS